MSRASLLITSALLALNLNAVQAAPARPVAPPAADSVVVLDTAKGKIVLQLDTQEAPKTCANFLTLVRKGFYSGTTFHRVIAGFMIQGGDPDSKDENPFNDGQGGPGYTVPAEIKLLHVRGAVAMARLSDSINPKRESSGSQFFICVADRPDLDRGGYTVFAHVISGMSTVDAIVALAKHKDAIQSSNGSNPGKLALIRGASIEPLAKWRTAPALHAPARPAAPVKRATAADSTH